MVDDGQRFAELSLAAFTQAIASSAPVPGGGSVAAVTAAFAAALVAMVARLSTDRERYAPFAATHGRALEASEAHRVHLLELADEDAAAYTEFVAARQLPRESPVEAASRIASLRRAAQHATDVPLRVIRECYALMDHVEALAGRSNLNAASDLEVAALLIEAAARGAAANVLVNLPSVGDERFTATTLAEIEARSHELASSAARVHSIVRSGNLRGPEAA